MKKTVCRITLIGMLFLVLIIPVNAMVFADSKTLGQIIGEAKSQITEVPVEQVKTDMDSGKDFVLLDVRSPYNYEAGHIANAVNIPRGDLEFMIGKHYPNKDTEMVLYCQLGGAAALCTKTLMDMGYKNVKSLKGAFKVWGESGYPIYNRHGEFKMIAFGSKE